MFILYSEDEKKSMNKTRARYLNRIEMAAKQASEIERNCFKEELIRKIIANILLSARADMCESIRENLSEELEEEIDIEEVEKYFDKIVEQTKANFSVVGR